MCLIYTLKFVVTTTGATAIILLYNYYMPQFIQL